METALGTNLITWLVIFPILAIVAVVIIWSIAKMGGAFKKKIAMIVAGLFAFAGFALVLIGIYFRLNPTFANTFRFYAYSALAPNDNPFQVSKGNYTPIVMRTEVYNDNGQIKFLSQLRPDIPSYITVFTSGRYINTKVNSGVLTVSPDLPGSERQTTKTSLWWALTKDLSRLNFTSR